MRVVTIVLLIAGLAASLVGTADAQGTKDKKWYLNLGVAGVDFAESADVFLGGAAVPATTADIPGDVTLSFEVGRRFDNNWAISFTGGIPPRTDLRAVGTITATVGRVNYAPAILTAHYHVPNFGPKFEPYFGAGINYTIVFNESGMAAQNLEVENGLGFVLQAGVESEINDRWGVFFDVKKVFVDVDAVGDVPGAGRLTADVVADPLLVSTGLTFRW